MRGLRTSAASILFISFLLSGLCLFANVDNGNVVEQANGVTIYPDLRYSGNTRAVRLQVINDKIIRVTASPEKKIPDPKSLILVPFTYSKNWKLVKKSDRVELNTPAIKATVMLSTGAVSFTDLQDRKLLSERPFNGRSLESAVYEGQPSYQVRQTFETTADDAYYGLGQHQDDQYNYKGQQVFLFQNNTEVAIPFLLSSKNYGLLWDNYSITYVGDARPLIPLSRLKLYSKEGEYGWLTASYSNDRNKPSEIAFVKAESDISYPFLNDTKMRLPADFNIQNGVITWEGSIESALAGTHKLKLTYAGYTRVWIDGKQQMDHWRQAWNPGSAVINMSLEANKKYPIKIEWIPDGGESYLTVGYLPPIPKEDINSYTFSSEAGKQLDYYFIAGNNADEVISGYRKLTGKATIVPKWAMGFWQSRERYKTQQELLDVVSEFRKRRIPLDNIVLDWSYWKEAEWGSQEFDASRFPDPEGMIKKVHDANAQIMISVWPKFYEGIPEYDDFKKNGFLYPRNVADRQRDWIGKGYVSTFYDAFNENARKAFWDLIHKKLYTKGIDAWWMDASEPDILSNVSPEKRKSQMVPLSSGIAAEYLGAYPLENAKGIYFGQRSVDTNKRVFLLTRSGFAGSQHYGATIWSGDIASRWEDMKSQISAGLNFSMSGLPFWTMDIGGFSVERRYERPNDADLEEWRELNTRWYQFGAFVPLFRAHGQFPFREIYNIAPENHPAYQSMLYYNKLRYRLMPYLYTLAGMTYHKDYTIMRGLIMDFPDDSAVKNIGDQYMFGPSLLINPVFSYKQRNREMYLPKGQGWYDLYSGKYLEGGRKISIDAPYERMPLFVKEGSIIPFGPELQYTNERPADTITLFVYTGKDASFELYEDGGDTYDYEKGKYSTIRFDYSEKNNTLTIADRKGSFEGMINDRAFRIVRISRNAPHPLSFDTNPPTTLYNGKKIVIRF